MSTESRIPSLSIDPFSGGYFADMHRYHEEMRETAPVFYLDVYGVYGIARHADVHAALRNWRTFCSGRGVGIEDYASAKRWREPMKLLETDPPLHTRTRTVLGEVLSRQALVRLKDDFQAHADRLVDELVQKRVIDGVRDLAQTFPLHVFPDAVGIPDDGRQNLLPFGDMVLNSFGPRNAIFEESAMNAVPLVSWINAQCARDRLRPGGFGAQVWDAFDAGRIDAEEAHALVRAMLTAGLDTTVGGLANALYAFATHTGQWGAVRENPQLLLPAFDEVLRWETPVQNFFRTTTEPVSVSGMEVPEGQKVLLFLGAANRDHRQYPKPEAFDVRRRASAHVAFGMGIHGCVGQFVARLEAEVVFRALAKRVSGIRLAGDPVWRRNNTLRTFASLPVELLPAA